MLIACRHCEGLASQTGATAAGTIASAVTSASLPPSPTASSGCVAHEDHWDCEAPIAGAAVNSGSAIAEDHDHTDAVGTGSLPPSPTASIGCEPHGDHWHCESPASATSALANAASSVASSSSASAAAFTGAADRLSIGAAAGAVGVFAMMI